MTEHLETVPYTIPYKSTILLAHLQHVQKVEQNVAKQACCLAYEVCDCTRKALLYTARSI